MVVVTFFDSSYIPILALPIDLERRVFTSNRHLPNWVLFESELLLFRTRLTWPQEWLQLLQSGRRRLDEAAAVQLVDAARRQFLQQKFQKAVTKA